MTLAMLLVAFALATLFLTAGNALAEEDGDYSFEVSDGLATIIGYHGPGGNVTIPETLGVYPVISIGTGAFYEKQSLVAVTIPDRVAIIGDYAFCNCTNLQMVSVGNGTLYIGDYSFEFCISLDTLVVESGDIGQFAFWKCVSLRDVSLGNGVTSIGNYAFWECISLPMIIIPESVMTIGTASFYACSSLIWIEVPDSVTTMGSYVFWECRSMISAKLGSGLTEIAAGTFCNCASLTELGITDRITSIGAFAFSQCSGLRSMKIPDNITTIGQYAFFMCTSLVHVEIGNGVHEIGNDAFSHCTALEALDIGREVSLVGIKAFSYCTALSYVILPASLETLGNAAFIGCGSLLSVAFEGEVRSIGTEAFTHCRALTSISFRGLIVPVVDSNWMYQSSQNVLGHAYSSSGFPAPGARFYGLMMGQYLPTVPGPPINVSLMPGDAEVTISWNEPGDGGGAPIAGYCLYMSAASQDSYVPVAASPGMEYTVKGLSNGQEYWFRISALNSLGEGSSSAAAMSIPGTPSAPLGISALAGSGGMWVSWSEPGRQGASRIVSYEVHRIGEGGRFLVATVDASTHAWRDTNVTEGNDYAYSVQAVNSYGIGPASVEASGVYEVSAEPKADQTWILVILFAGLAVITVIVLIRRKR